MNPFFQTKILAILTLLFLDIVNNLEEVLLVKFMTSLWLFSENMSKITMINESLDFIKFR